MPLFNESYDAEQYLKHHHQDRYLYSLEDAFRRKIPITSIEFNPPPVTGVAKQAASYWQGLSAPDAEDQKVLSALKAKLEGMKRCRKIGAFVSVTDSAAGVLRMNNLAMLRLLSDPNFTETWLGGSPLELEPPHTIVHLTRNHSISWLGPYLDQCLGLGFHNLLIITGDPLKEVRYRPVRLDQVAGLGAGELENCRLKNSVDMLRFVRAHHRDFFAGVGHNPFLRKEAAQSHLLRKVEAGARFIITQPVSYYEECWRVMGEFQRFCREERIDIPVVLGVFNYFVPMGKKGFREKAFEKRHKFWKRLFGFVPGGVRQDYELGLNGIEILARSINKLKRMGSFHFDVMNAEKQGWSISRDGQRLAHELDRISGAFDAC